MKKMFYSALVLSTVLMGACSPKEENQDPSSEIGTPVNTSVTLESISTSIKEAMVAYWDEESIQLEDNQIPGWEELSFDDELAEGMYPFLADFNGFILTPLMNVKSDLIAVAKVENGNKDQIKTAFEELHANQERTWSQYLPAQYEKVKNAQVITSGDYMMYVIFDDVSPIEDAFLNVVDGE